MTYAILPNRGDVASSRPGPGGDGEVMGTCDIDFLVFGRTQSHEEELD